MKTAFANKIELLLKNPEMVTKLSAESIKISNKFWAIDKSGKRLFNHLEHAIDNYND